MAKSIKLNNETYIDSSGVIHEKQTLNAIIDELKQLKPTILYDNSNGSTGNITLNESINNFSAFCIFFTKSGRSYSTGKCLRLTETTETINVATLTYSENVYESGKYFLKTSNEHLTINDMTITRGEEYISKVQMFSSTVSGTATSTNRSSIIRVEGYK